MYIVIPVVTIGVLLFKVILRLGLPNVDAELTKHVNQVKKP